MVGRARRKRQSPCVRLAQMVGGYLQGLVATSTDAAASAKRQTTCAIADVAGDYPEMSKEVKRNAAMN